MKHYLNHSCLDMLSSAIQGAVRRAVTNYAIAWLVNITLDKGITNQPPIP